MLPLRENSSSPKVADSRPAPSTEISSATEAPQKLPIWAVDHGADNRDDFTAMGGWFDPEAHENAPTYPLPPMGLATVTEGSNRTDTNDEHEIDTYSLRAPNSRVSQSFAPSESSAPGRSWTEPSDGLSSIHLSENHPTADREAQRQSGSHNRAFCIFPWHNEFTWENSRLLFASEPFFAGRAAEIPLSIPISNLAVASANPPQFHAESCLRLHLSGDQEFDQAFIDSLLFGIGGPGESWSTSSSSDSAEGTESKARISLARKETINCIANYILVEYMRSHGPQRSGRGNGVSQNPSGSRAGGVNPRTPRRFWDSLRPRYRRPGRATNDGQEDDDDEDSNQDGPGLGDTKYARHQYYIACPFLRWQPSRYRGMCVRTIKTLPILKQHLRRFHYERYCASCYALFGKHGKEHHNCQVVPQPVRPAPVEVVTHAKRQVIDRYAEGARGRAMEERLVGIYTTLFPDDPPAWEPLFLNHMTVMTLEDVESYFYSELPQNIVRDELMKAESSVKDFIKDHKAVYEAYMPLAIQYAYPIFASSSESRPSLSPPSAMLTYGNEWPAQLEYHMQGVISDTVDPSTLQHLVVEVDSSQRPPDFVATGGTYPGFGLEPSDQPPIPALGALGAPQPISGQKASVKSQLPEDFNDQYSHNGDIEDPGIIGFEFGLGKGLSDPVAEAEIWDITDASHMFDKDLF